MDIDTLWKAGKVIHGYTMLEDAHEGAEADIRSVWGKAKSPTGKTVFFKKYTSPSSTFDDWYQGYVDYQKELKKRIDQITSVDAHGRVQGPTYRFIEFFEENDPAAPDLGPLYYQVMDYIDGAQDLQKYLDSDSTTWNDRTKFASVFMFAMKTLHASRIIHTDLKPKNLLLIPVVTSSGARTYQIKIIDLDASILSDRKAPWDGISGYTGSPGYHSPEHLRGEIPTEKSDIFTCGLILYELLTAEGHPYGHQSDLEVYEAYRAPVPRLRGSYGSPEKDAAVAEMLHRMLDPNPARRPDALEVQRLLTSGNAVRRPTAPEPVAPPTGRPADDRPSVAVPPSPTPVRTPAADIPDTPAPPSVTVPPPPPAPAVPVFKLKTEGSDEGIRVFPNSTIGHKYLDSLLPEAKKYYSREHFAILFRDGKWFIRHCAPAAENRTAVNGQLVEGELELHSGDIIAAASKDGSKTVLPMIVEIGG